MTEKLQGSASSSLGRSFVEQAVVAVACCCQSWFLQDDLLKAVLTEDVQAALGEDLVERCFL